MHNFLNVLCLIILTNEMQLEKGGDSVYLVWEASGLMDMILRTIQWTCALRRDLPHLHFSFLICKIRELLIISFFHDLLAL